MPSSWISGFALALAASTAPFAAQRCDLVARKCLDFTSRNSATLTVPSSTTRIPHDGLVLCDVPGSSPAPTDIVYIVDQSTSMKPTAIQSKGNDTTGWFGCDDDLACTGTFTFHGSRVCQIPSTTSKTAIDAADCQEAGDIYSARAEAVYASIRSQSVRAPTSHAATVNFNRGVSTTQIATTRLDAAGATRLQGTVPMNVGSSTNYEAPLQWARILLHGGVNATRGTTIAASPNAGKAVILISDGQPNNGDWRRALGNSATVSMTAAMFPGVANANAYAGTWNGTPSAVPPVYGIYLGNNAGSADTLKRISEMTGGTFHLIPPNQPDSLGRVIESILGSLIGAAVPTTFSITNLSNGLTSSAASPTYDAAAGGYRVVLDSLLPLESGANKLLLKTNASVDGVPKTLADTISVDVSGEGTATRGGSGLDSILSARCMPASTLRLAPDVSGLPYCEASRSDAHIAATLETVPANYAVLPITFRTVGRSDREGLSLPVPPLVPDNATGSFTGEIPWARLAGTASNPGDGTVRSGYGWDTAVAWFQMPRDKRDTASARIALHRSGSPSIVMTDSVIGPEGFVTVVVVDSASTASTLTVVVRGGTGLDTLWLTLARTADHIYNANFPFVQGWIPDRANAVLELAAAGGFGETITGTYASAEGEISDRTVVVSDAVPTGARIVDTDADGKADRVIVQLRKPLIFSDSIGFLWPDTSGFLVSRRLPLGAGRSNGDGTVLTFDVEPFPFGATACPVAGCQELGSVMSSLSTGKGSSRFAIADGVDPIPTSARYRYAVSSGDPDTLIVGFSEPMRENGLGNWVSVGRPGLDSLGTGVHPVAPAWLEVDRRTAYFLVDSTFAGRRGDSLRITTSVTGALFDTSGNGPERLSYWTPLNWGAPLPELSLEVPQPVVRFGTTEAPSDEPAVTRFVRKTEDAPWTSVEGGSARGLTRFSGVVVKLNRIPTNLKMYVYDNMGVVVLRTGFTDLAALADAGLLPRTRRGDYEIWLAWDGKDERGRPVATGVYFVRLHARIHDGEEGRLLLNAVKKVGIHRSIAP